MTRHRLICTGVGTHKEKRLGTYELLEDGGFFVVSKAGIVGHWRPETPSTQMFEWPCSRCPLGRKRGPRTMRFAGEKLDKFLRAPGAAQKDLSLLARTLT